MTRQFTPLRAGGRRSPRFGGGGWGDGGRRQSGFIWAAAAVLTAGWSTQDKPVERFKPLDPEKIQDGDKDKTISAALSVDETRFKTAYSDDSATITSSLKTLEEAGAAVDLRFRISPLAEATGLWAKKTHRLEESSGPAEPGDMPMVDLGIPPGFNADLVASDPNVARYEIKRDRVQIYLHHLPEEAGTAFELKVPMSPRYAMEVTTPLARAGSFYKPTQGSESIPTVLTVR